VSGRVVVVGLGPAGGDLLLPVARRAIEDVAVRFARTRHHPAVEDLVDEGVAFRSFDDLYEQARNLDEVYSGIVRALLEVARSSQEVVYAVPGNPVLAERTVALLHEKAEAGTIELELVPGLSFAELAWGRVGVDPMHGARIVDGRTLTTGDIGIGGPLLIAQVDNAVLLSDVKLTLLEVHAPDTPVTVLDHLGLPEERVETVVLAELDHRTEPTHLTSLFVDAPASGEVVELARLLELARTLRRPGGCPWDAEQTHHSLTRYLLEEAYEVVEAVERLPARTPEGGVDDAAYAALEDELGDLLYQVVFHAVLAEEAGAFDMVDVARGIHDKLVRRHPHVFGDTEAETSADVMKNWEQIKKEEKGGTSLVEGISPGLPSLLYAHKLYRKAASIGLDPGDIETTIARLRTAADAISGAGADDIEAALGEFLAAAVAVARAHGIDAESALRGWAAHFRDQFVAMEQLAESEGVDLAAAPPAEVAALWERVGA
jgi:tetrapyrrole methylase family protein / MazG family protein